MEGEEEEETVERVGGNLEDDDDPVGGRGEIETCVMGLSTEREKERERGMLSTPISSWREKLRGEMEASDQTPANV